MLVIYNNYRQRSKVYFPRLSDGFGWQGSMRSPGAAPARGLAKLDLTTGANDVQFYLRRDDHTLAPL